MKLMKNTLSTVSKLIAIAIGDRKATIAIGDLFSNGDRDRDRNFRDRGHALTSNAFHNSSAQIKDLLLRLLFSVLLFLLFDLLISDKNRLITSM